MSWDDYYLRRDVMEAVLRQARRRPEGTLSEEDLPFAEIPGAVAVFGSVENLLLALQYKWTRLLSGYLRAEVAGPEDAGDLPSGTEHDHFDAVSRAWHASARDHETLRAVLDANVARNQELRRMHEAELRMLALMSGLAEPHEPVEEITRIGSTFEALLRNNPVHAAPRRRRPVGQLLRMLAPTA